MKRASGKLYWKMSRKKSMSEVKTNLQNMPMMTAQITPIGTRSRRSSGKHAGRNTSAGADLSGLRTSGGSKLGSSVSEGGALPMRRKSRANVTEPRVRRQAAASLLSYVVKMLNNSGPCGDP